MRHRGERARDLREGEPFTDTVHRCPATGKPRCYDKRGAMTAINWRWNHDRVKLRAYPCRHCNHWHLTSQV